MFDRLSDPRGREILGAVGVPKDKSNRVTTLCAIGWGKLVTWSARHHKWYNLKDLAKLSIWSFVIHLEFFPNHNNLVPLWFGFFH